MATVSQLPASCNLVCTVGNDFTLTLAVTENGSTWSSTGATLATDIIARDGTVVATDFTTAATDGQVTLTLTDANTTTLGVGVYSYRLSVTKSGNTRDWIAGTLSVVEAGIGGTTSSAASLSITTGAVSLSTTTLVAPEAAQISVTDAADYYTGDTVEEVLAELPGKFAISATGKVMEVPTYDYDLDVTHFSVLDYGPGATWNGYRYWMAFTPYPDSSRENPSILRSSDGLTWAVPAGVTNPVWSAADAVSAGYAYNSDTHLIDLDGTTQAMYFRTGTAVTKNAVWVTTSSDGWATKTTPVVVLSDLANESTLLSPAVVHDGTNYRMYVCDFTNSAVNYYTSSTHNGTFATKVACTVPSWLTGKVWHLDVQKKGSTYYMLANSNETTSAGSNLYVLTSTDGVTFTKADVYPDVYPNDYGFARHYRSALVVRADGAYDIYASALDSSQTTWRGVAYQGIVNGRSLTAQQSVDDITAATRSLNSFFPGAPYSWTVSDNFQRADAITLGTTTSGAVWSMLTGTAGISSGQAYAITNMRAVVEASISDVEIRCDIAGSAMSEFYVILRATDASNWWRIGTDGVSGRLRIEKFVAASLTTVTSLTSPAWRIGDQLKVRATGSTIYVYRNNVLSTTVTDSFNSTATKHGIGGLAGNVRFANWGVKAYS